LSVSILIMEKIVKQTWKAPTAAVSKPYCIFEMETTQQMIKHLRLAHSELSVFTIAILEEVVNGMPVDFDAGYHNSAASYVCSSV